MKNIIDLTIALVGRS